MDLKYLSLQDDVRDGLLRVSHVPTDILLADFLTKPCCQYKLTQFCHAIRLMPELTLESGYEAGGMSAVEELREVHLVELGDEEHPFEFDKKLWAMFFIVAMLAVLGCIDVIHRIRRMLLKIQLRGRQRGSYPTATPKNRAAAIGYG